MRKLVLILLALLCYQRAMLCYLELPNADFIVGYEQKVPHVYCVSDWKFYDFIDGEVTEVFPDSFRPRVREDLKSFIYRVKRGMRIH